MILRLQDYYAKEIFFISLIIPDDWEFFKIFGFYLNLGIFFTGDWKLFKSGEFHPRDIYP